MPFSNSALISFLDNDFYKLTTQHGVFKLFPRAEVSYRFINRGNHSFPPHFAEQLQEAVAAMSKLKLTEEEKAFLALTCPYLDPTYLDFLQGYEYDDKEVKITLLYLNFGMPFRTFRRATSFGFQNYRSWKPC